MARKSVKRASPLLDVFMAAVAAGSVAFVVYAMPDRHFGGLVEVSGLPQLLPAAQPPLGLTARIGALAAAALATFGLVWLLLRALGPKKPEPKRKTKPVEIDVAPKIRRADAHPDAPARRPIFAALDLGDPDAQAEALAEALAEDVAFTPLDEAEMEVEPFEPAPETVPAMAARLPEPPEAISATIPDLMQRLELGLLRKQSPDWPVAEAPPAEPAEDAAEIDDRLRSAIEGLQQLARRG